MFRIVNEYITRYTGTDREVIVPDNVKGIYELAFSNANSMQKLVLPENVVYCVGDHSSILSNTVEEIVLYNATYTGTFNLLYTPNLKKISILDTNISRIASARPLISKLMVIPASVKIYFPNINLFACDRSALADIIMCERFLRNEQAYTPSECQKFYEYIKMHSGNMLDYLIGSQDIDLLHRVLPLCQPKSISNTLDKIQELGDTELTAVALDLIGKNHETSNAFDISFLSDLAEGAPTLGQANFQTPDSIIGDFEIRGVEDNYAVLGACLGESNIIVYPAKLDKYIIEGIGAPNQQFKVSPFAVCVSNGIAAIFRTAMFAYNNLQMVVLPQTIQYIDELAFLPNSQQNIVFYCIKDSYAERWALEHNYTVKDISSFQQDYSKKL